MEYTKGEWRVSWNGYDYQIITDGGIDYILIAKSGKKANAHLIAAAPELYEALQKVVFRLKLVSKGTFELPADAEAVKQAEQAIAKAEGKL